MYGVATQRPAKCQTCFTELRILDTTVQQKLFPNFVCIVNMLSKSVLPHNQL